MFVFLLRITCFVRITKLFREMVSVQRTFPNMEKKKRALPIIKAQKELLLEFMGRHPELRSGRFTPTFTFQKAKELWMEITSTLNAIPSGSNKDWRQWRKTWQDYKKSAKAKAAQHNVGIRQTGGGPPPPSPKPEEVQILDLLSETEIYGIPSMTETAVDFCFNDNKENSLMEISTSNKQEQEKENLTIETHDLAVAESLEISETNANEDHTYNLVHPTQTNLKMKRAPQKLNKTRRLENSLKVSQLLLKSVNKKEEVMENYYTKKVEYLEHKKKCDLENLALLRESNNNNKKMLEKLTLLVNQISAII